MLALVSLIAASCVSRASVDPDSGEPTSPLGTATNAEVPPVLAFDGPEPSVPEVLRLGMARPASFLPHEISLADQEAVIVADLLYDGLTEAVGTEGRLAPALARQWDANIDFSRWTFQLDPSRASADEVVAHFQMLLRSTSSPAVTSMLADVDRVEAVSPSSVEIALDHPNAGLPWLMSSVALSVVGPDGTPTGHFTIGSQDDRVMVLVSSGPARPAQRKTLHQIELRWGSTADDVYDDLTLGFLDAAVAPPAAMGDARQRFGAVPTARAISRFYGVNTVSSELADERLRRAVLLAVDRERIAENMAAAPVFAAGGLLAPTLAGYQTSSCGEACRYDPDEAASLVAQVEADLRVQVTLSVAFEGDDQRSTAQALADDLRQVGIGVELLQQSPQQLATTMGTGRADLFAFGWVAGAGSLDAVVPALLRSSSSANGLNFRSIRVDELIDQAARTGDDQARWALLTEAHNLAMGEGHVLPLAVAQSYLVAAPQAASLIVRADGSIDVGASR